MVSGGQGDGNKEARGRPRKRWIDCVRDDGRVLDLSRVGDRRQWRAVSRRPDPPWGDKRDDDDDDVIKQYLEVHEYREYLAVTYAMPKSCYYLGVYKNICHSVQTVITFDLVDLIAGDREREMRERWNQSQRRRRSQRQR